jgi:hypothetical protein
MNTKLFANPQLFQAYNNDPRMAMAQGLMQQGASTAPVRSPLEGLARALTAGVGGLQARQTTKGYQQQDDQYRQGLAEALKGGDVIGALQNSNQPQLQQMALEAKIRQAMDPAKDPLLQVYDPNTKTMVYKPQSQAVGQQAKGPDTPKLGEVRKFRQGAQEIAQEWDGAKWGPLGQGPAFAPPATTTVNVGPTGIDYGDPEPGLAWKRNADGSVALDERGAPIALPYQGGKPYAEAQKVQQAAETKESQQQQAADIVTQDIDRALALADSATIPTTGIVGSFVKDIGGTAANDTRALLDTIKANVGFDKLQQMRASSPTGGALGSITEGELKLLSSVLGNLEQSQSKDQFKANLGRLKEIYLDVIHGPGNRPGRATGGDSAVPPPPPGFEVVP